MIALISFFVILVISLIIVRVAAAMLQLTGISSDTARFQARSAFTGVGYTTREAEMIINHPVRRRIIGSLMLIGNIGFVTFVSSLVISFLSAPDQEALIINVVLLLGGLILIYLITRMKIFDRLLGRIIGAFLKKWTKIHSKDYESLLNLSGDFEVITIPVKPESWLADRTLENLKLADEGILVLGIRREDGYFQGSPRGETEIYVYDQLIAYGREKSLKRLGERRKGAEGDLEHRFEVERQLKLEGKSPRRQRMKDIASPTGALKKILQRKQFGP
jgi:hypothetical protein